MAEDAKQLRALIAELRNQIQILIMELDLAYRGLATLPDQHSAKQAVQAARAVLEKS
jgi:hypothetical protein